MKHRAYLIALIAVLLAALACNFPWEPSEGTSPPDETEAVVTEPEPIVTTEDIETEVPTEEPTEAETQEPTEEPTEAPYACAAGMVPATAYTVEFCYPAAYASGFSQNLIPENPPAADTPPWGINPETIEIILSGYPVTNVYHDPRILIYPVDAFIALDPYIATTVANLQVLLASEDPNPSSIPFLPRFNAAQMMQAKVSYITFRNGKGVRFITQYSQAAIPVSNDSAFYGFVGLTDDGQYFFSVTLPVTHTLFYPDMMTEPAEGWMTFAENFESYIDDMELALSTQAQDTFYPYLTPLDEMMGSFLIPPGAIP